jgi:type IX secretion system PorP/SprF family membrane protein
LHCAVLTPFFGEKLLLFHNFTDMKTKKSFKASPLSPIQKRGSSVTQNTGEYCIEPYIRTLFKAHNYLKKTVKRLAIPLSFGEGIVVRYAFLFILFMLPLSLFSQERMLMTSHYVHNQYMINPAFAGSREALSIFGSFRQQWWDTPNPPSSQNVTIHAPLKSEHVALGGFIYNEKFAVYANFRATLSYTYRLFLGRSKLAFSLNGGFSSANYGNMDIELIDIENPDEAFEQLRDIESDNRPVLGFGTAWYGERFFAGFSVYDFFYRTPFDYEASFFSFGRSSMNLTAGYLFDVSNSLRLQPSALLKFGPQVRTLADISLSAIILDLVWVGGTYRTNNEFVAVLGWQITPRMRATYSYDFPTGELRKFNAGSHEISLQFDFGYRVNTTSPRFF